MRLETVDNDLVRIDGKECKIRLTDMACNNVDILLLNAELALFPASTFLLILERRIRLLSCSWRTVDKGINVDGRLVNHVTCHVVPFLVLQRLTDSHDQLIILMGDRTVDNERIVVVHILNTFVVLEIPNLDVALRQRHQDVLPWQGVDGCYS